MDITKNKGQGACCTIVFSMDVKITNNTIVVWNRSQYSIYIYNRKEWLHRYTSIFGSPSSLRWIVPTSSAVLRVTIGTRSLSGRGIVYCGGDEDDSIMRFSISPSEAASSELSLSASASAASPTTGGAWFPTLKSCCGGNTVDRSSMVRFGGRALLPPVPLPATSWVASEDRDLPHLSGMLLPMPTLLLLLLPVPILLLVAIPPETFAMAPSAPLPALPVSAAPAAADDDDDNVLPQLLLSISADAADRTHSR